MSFYDTYEYYSSMENCIRQFGKSRENKSKICTKMVFVSIKHTLQYK